jgi:DNA-binding CsgD family transcriptional regulator
MKGNKTALRANENAAATWIKEMHQLLSSSPTKDASLEQIIESQIKRCLLIENNLQTESMLFLLDNSTMKYLFVSRSAVDVLGYSKDEIIENGLQWIFTLFSPEELKYKTELMNDIYSFLKTLDEESLKSSIVRYDIVASTKSGECIHFIEELMFPLVEGNKPLITTCFIHVIDNHGFIDERKCIIIRPSIRGRDILFSKSYFVGSDSILTAREKQVLENFSNGLSTSQVANRLHVSENTIKTHRKNILLKLKVQNTAEAIKVTLKNRRST